MLVRAKVFEPVLHIPVMADQVVQALDVQPGGRYVDCTVGTGGHAEAILEAASPGGLLLGIDLDSEALAVARERLAQFGSDVRLVEGNYRDLAAICSEFNFVPVHGVLFDLGLSSFQLARPERGFSFQLEGPLDMRFGPEQETTAFDIVNSLPERELADLIWRYGEEPQARRIARAIVRERPIATTTHLAEVVARAAGRGKQRIHPATRTFQALRIAVNQELENLEMALSQAVQVLGRGGRLVVISYHSLEDRLVKQFIQRESQDCICPPAVARCRCGHRATLRPVVKGVIRPSPQEVEINPRARSAKLRVAERV
jgi:16S rRNA (cytosine1402-N4)-methyltransferase